MHTYMYTSWAFSYFLLTMRICLLALLICLLAMHICLLAMQICQLAMQICLLAMHICLLAISICLLAMSICLLAMSICLLAMNICLLDGNAIAAAQHLYGAGTETTATSLNWAILYTCLNPEVKRKVHDEIDNTIGKLNSHNAVDVKSSI